MKSNSAFFDTLKDFMSLLKLVMIGVFILFALSGTTLVKPGEVAMILRLGALVGNNRAEQLNPAGWLFALPYPIDIVVRVPEKEIKEIKITELSGKETSSKTFAETINPIEEGYCISGDHNIFQLSATVKFQVSDPAKAMFNYSNDFKTLIPFLRNTVVQALTQVSASFAIDGILAEKKEEIAAMVKENAQNRLEKFNTGLNILSIELAQVTPPMQLKDEFENVNSAYIKRKNFINEALSEREQLLPKAQAFCQQTLNSAHAYHEKVVSEADAKAGKFLELLAACKNNPSQIKQGLIDKTRKKIFSNLSGLSLIPGVSLCPANARIIIENSKVPALPYDDNFYSGEATDD